MPSPKREGIFVYIHLQNMMEVRINPVSKVVGPYIEQVCANAGLQQTMKGSLKSIPVNTHWHFKKGKEKGILEITLYHHSGEVVLLVHDNRKGDWIPEVVQFLKTQLES